MFSAERNPVDHALKVGDTAEKILFLFPEIEQIADIEIRPPIMLKLSENITPDDWVTIAHAIKKEFNENTDGIVVTHGTYTMGYTCAALNFMIKNNPVPVILTGSQVPIKENKLHLKSNLLNSIYVAGHSDVSGANIVFSGDEDSTFSNIYRGTRTRKCFSWKINCFRSISEAPLGSIKNNTIKYFAEGYLRINKNNLPEFNTHLCKQVALVKAYPGIQPEIFDYLIDNKCKGIILEGYPDGSFPITDNFIKSLLRAKRENVPIFATSQSFGNVTLTEYASGRKMLDSGVIPLGDMLTETALVKLMWILGKTNDINEVKTEMQKEFAREIRLGSWIK